MGSLQLQPSLATDLRSQAVLACVNRWDSLDLTQILVNRLDSVPDSALIFLAWQFDVLSPLWLLLSPGSARRSLIKQSTQLHSQMGTPSALKTALANLGWTATLQEGESTWGGSAYGANGWAAFRVLIHIGAGPAPTSDQLGQIQAAANFFKPARCILDQVVVTT